jgi:hypothetical protein
MKLDFKKELKHLYGPSAREVVQVEVPELRFLMIDGEGDPNTSESYAQAVEALFSVSYTAKFMVKKGPSAVDYGVMPLEGLWWSEDMSAFETGDRSLWKWTMMIMQPDLVPPEVLERAIAEVDRKKGPPRLGELRIERFTEGTCAPVLHPNLRSVTGVWTGWSREWLRAHLQPSAGPSRPRALGGPPRLHSRWPRTTRGDSPYGVMPCT